ncbi:MAG: lipopolysaccharide heptosyltransferase II [Candidatus Omnitrophota bacterium]
MKRILIVSINWLGDAIMTTPVFKALKDRIPDAYVAVMAHNRVLDVYSENPYIDEIIAFDEKTSQKGLIAKLRFISLLKHYKFDTVFLLHRSLTRAFICFLAGIKRRVGYCRGKTNFLITDCVKADKKILHRQDYYLSLFEKAGVKIENTAYQFFVSEQNKIKANALLENIKSKHSTIIGIHPSANWNLKRWPTEKFAELTDRLVDKFNYSIVIIGSKADAGTCDYVADSTLNKALNLCGKTNLKELAAVIGNFDLFISNDSGPAHLASAMGAKTLVIFGPTSPDITGPRGNNITIIKKNTECTIPCYNLDCANNRCIADITVDEVFEKAVSLYNRCNHINNK